MSVELATPVRPTGFSPLQYAICLKGIVWREGLRFLHQRERFVASLVRPLVWLFIFAAGFRQVLGVSIIPPYETYVLYEVYITPGLMLMIQLFNGMQSSLSMVYDREMGNMRTLLVSPLPRWYLLSSKLDRRHRRVASAGLHLSGDCLVLGDRAAADRLPDGVAGVGAVGPDARRARHADVVGHQAAREFCRRDELRDLPDVLRLLRALSAVAGAEKEARCFTTYARSTRSPMRSSWSDLRSTAKINWISLAVVCGCTIVFMVGAILAYDPSRGLLARRGEPGRRRMRTKILACGHGGRARIARRSRLPPIRATPTGRATRSRCLSCRWPRCGRARRSMTSANVGEQDPAIRDLVARLAARRTPLEDAQKNDRGRHHR